MIIKASQRGGARQMALHLLNGQQNEHVNLHEIRNFVADDVMGALNEVYALSKGTKCKQFLFSVSLSPPPGESVPVQVFEEALERIEKKLGLEGQPRVVVFHEKEARRHAHAVYSRIDVEAMKAINLPHFKNKLMAVSKSLYLDHSWSLPKGFIDKNQKSPLNYTRAEWQKALRTGRNPKAIKAALQESWAISDCRKSFEQALSERGYFLARGDRRGHVVVDVYGEVYALPRQLGLKAKDVRERLGVPSSLPTVIETKAKIERQVKGLFRGYLVTDR
ncbi:MAG: relaxase/mobilization nuclease domain-containing protein [Candidatus Thiodiazotropha sp.]